MYAGAIKGNPLLKWIPIDLTLLAFVLLLFPLIKYVSHQLGDLYISPLSTLALVSFVPGMLLAGASQYAHSKLLGFLISLVGFICARFLINSDQHLREWIILQLILGIAATLVALHSGLNIDNRLDIVGGNTISTARLTGASVVLLAILSMTLTKRLFARAIILGAALLLCQPLISTGSRGPVIAVAITLCLSALVIARKGTLVRVTLAALVVAIGYRFITTTTDFGATRLRLSLTGQINATAERNIVWDSAIESLIKHPWGIGWGNFIQALPPGTSLDPSGRAYAHNVFLEAAVEGGWYCGLLLILLTVVIIYKLRQFTRDPYGSALLAVTLFFAINALSSGDINDNRTLWCALGVGAAITLKRNIRGCQPDTELTESNTDQLFSSI